MLLITFVFCTLIAACLGSFSNVIIYRIPNHMSIAWPPSTCPKCGNRIKPYDNIPVLSWLILRGKCRNCKNPISIQYPVIEFICALFGFFLCCQIFGPFADHFEVLSEDGVFWRLMVLFFGRCIFLVGCLALAVMDLKTTEIAPEVALPIAAIGVITALVVPDIWPFATIVGNIHWLDAVIGGLIGGSLIVIIIGAYFLLTRRIGMGGGDIWMMVMVGACLGWECLPFIFLAASLQGIVAAAIAIALGKRQQTDTQNGLFRNTVIADIQPGSADQTKPSEQPESAESDQLEAHDSQATETAAETPETPTTDNEENPDEIETGKLAVPFGPFIGLAAIEYAFFGQFVLPLMTNGLLSPWGMMH